jgi:hypothetical protein
MLPLLGGFKLGMCAMSVPSQNLFVDYRFRILVKVNSRRLVV